MPEPFDAPFMQRALLESLLLAGLAYELNVGPGPATAVLGGAVFAIVVAVTR